MVIVTIPDDVNAGMDWTVTELGKIEKANSGRAQESVAVKVRP